MHDLSGFFEPTTRCSKYLKHSIPRVFSSTLESLYTQGGRVFLFSAKHDLVKFIPCCCQEHNTNT